MFKKKNKNNNIKSLYKVSQKAHLKVKTIYSDDHLQTEQNLTNIFFVKHFPEVESIKLSNLCARLSGSNQSVSVKK